MESKPFWNRQLLILLFVLLLWPVVVGVYRVLIVWYPELCEFPRWGGMAMDKACEWRDDGK